VTALGPNPDLCESQLGAPRGAQKSPADIMGRVPERARHQFIHQEVICYSSSNNIVAATGVLVSFDLTRSEQTHS
jgi:hypothetical protein